MAKNRCSRGRSDAGGPHDGESLLRSSPSTLYSRVSLFFLPRFQLFPLSSILRAFTSSSLLSSPERNRNASALPRLCLGGAHRFPTAACVLRHYRSASSISSSSVLLPQEHHCFCCGARWRAPTMATTMTLSSTIWDSLSSVGMEVRL